MLFSIVTFPFFPFSQRDPKKLCDYLFLGAVAKGRQEEVGEDSVMMTLKSGHGVVFPHLKSEKIQE